MSPATPHKPERPLFFISAAEPSADLHGASLIRATLARCPAARFFGVAGPRMREAGCERIFDMARHSAMLVGALRQAGRAAAMLSCCDRHLRRQRVDAAVVIDSPTLHLPLAGRAHALGIPVLYFIAPQMWAWCAYRIYKQRHRTDRVAVILPFEEEYFRGHGINAHFVGHPLADKFHALTVDEQAVRAIRADGTPVVALFPGSREHVVREVLRGQIEVAAKISQEIPGATFGVSVANPQVRGTVEAAIARCPLPIRAFADGHDELLRAADLVLVASGTTTLEVAFHLKPMIVMYNSSRLLYHLIGRWLIHTKHYSLPNILAGREIVPEFMPYYRSTAPIARRAIELLRSSEQCAVMSRNLERTVEPLRGGGASERTAETLLDMAGAL